MASDASGAPHRTLCGSTGRGDVVAPGADPTPATKGPSGDAPSRSSIPQPCRYPLGNVASRAQGGAQDRRRNFRGHACPQVPPAPAQVRLRSNGHQSRSDARMTAAPRHCPARCELEELRAQTIEQGKAGGRRGGTRPARDAHGRPRAPLASACAMNWVLVRLLRGACGPAAGAFIGRFGPDAGDLAGYGAPGRSPRIPVRPCRRRAADIERRRRELARRGPHGSAVGGVAQTPPASSPARITSRNGSQRSDPSPSTGASASVCALSKMRVGAASRSWLSSAATAASSQSRRKRAVRLQRDSSRSLRVARRRSGRVRRRGCWRRDSKVADGLRGPRLPTVAGSSGPRRVQRGTNRERHGHGGAAPTLPCRGRQAVQDAA